MIIVNCEVSFCQTTSHVEKSNISLIRKSLKLPSLHKTIIFIWVKKLEITVFITVLIHDQFLVCLAENIGNFY